MSLEEFLRNRGLPESVVLHFIQEKMDCSTILLMSEEDLKNLIPKYGDRVAIRNFAMKKKTSKKQSRIEKLRENINKRNGTGDSSRAIQKKRIPLNKRDLLKSAGIIWTKVYRDIDNKSKEILDVGKKLFFPNGISTKGPLAAFEIELLDYKCHKFDSNITIQEMYELSALTTLRFYVATTRKSDDSDDDESYYISATVIRSNSNQENDSEIETPTIRRSQRLRSSGVLQEYVANYIADEYVPDTQFSIESEVVVGSGDYDLFNLNENNIYELPSLQNYSQPNQNIQNLVVHRGNVFKELVEAVKARNIQLQNVHIEMILPNGSSEQQQQQDMGGVLRDTISEFFTTFYEICTMGADFKVPCLRHDLQKEEWQAIAKIISQSYESEGYFPIKIAPVFIKECFGQSVGDDEVLNNFFKYVSSSESCLLKNALERFEGSRIRRNN
ncbi:hypothetical protein JTB14_002626 [Gonioctena quinquepunctata]|nr:hypothetical protein JTB14_002626 [Gonioctena quinquepunctata]